MGGELELMQWLIGAGGGGGGLAIGMTVQQFLTRRNGVNTTAQYAELHADFKNLNSRFDRMEKRVDQALDSRG